MKKYYIRFDSDLNINYVSIDNLHPALNYECECEFDLHEKMNEYKVISIDKENKTCSIKIKN